MVMVQTESWHETLIEEYEILLLYTVCAFYASIEIINIL